MDMSTMTFEKNGVIKGNALFVKRDGFIEVNIELSDFEPNSSHAAHIHVGECVQPGPHWNMESKEAFCLTDNMGETWGKPFAGDVENIRIDENGNGTITVRSSFWTMGTGLDSDIVGRALVIHNHADDFVWACRNNELPQMTHSSNTKVACGEISLVPAD